MTPTLALPEAPPAFKYIGGDPSLDLINTVDWTSAGPVNDRLPDYRALVAWGLGAGVIAAPAAERLRRVASARPAAARAAHGEAIRLRQVLHEVFGGVAIAGEAPAAALAELNRMLADALGRLGIARPDRSRDGRRHRWEWHGMGTRLESVLWPVLRAAGDLLTSEEADRVHACAGPDCGWMYVDRSRNGFRRWCQMQTCGTREMSRRRRL